MSELHIPRITPVRVKTEPIAQELINPGSSGYYFPREVGPRVVYLDGQYDYPDDNGIRDAVTEQARQESIWHQFDLSRGTKFMDRHVEDRVGVDGVHKAREETYDSLGFRDTAEFYERVFGAIFGKSINVVIISTGVKQWDGGNYHDIGYLGE